jgi:hypothetical protein
VARLLALNTDENNVRRPTMVQYFDDNPTNAKRALQIWQILICKAHNHQTITYGDLAELLGFKGAGVVGHKLEPILDFCNVHGLPPLTCLVVNSGTGLPSPDSDLVLLTSQADRERVYQFNWYGLVPPTPEEFDQAHRQVRG